MTKSLKIAIAQINATVGDIAGNRDLVLAGLKRAAKDGADLVIFPELVITSYPPEDLILKPAFRDEAYQALEMIARATRAGGPALLVGCPAQQNDNIYNALYLLGEGKILHRQLKVHLPNYGVFDEKRIFSEGPMPEVVPFRGITLGLLVCEDMWYADIAGHLKQQGADILIAPHASPFEDAKRDVRIMHAKARVAETGLPLVFVNQVGGQDELVFDGSSFVLDKSGRRIAQLKEFEEDYQVLEVVKNGTWAVRPGVMAALPDGTEQLYQALMYGLREYVGKNKFPGVLIGLSGGVDSALTAALAVDALGPGCVDTVMMPSPYTRPESFADAKACARKLGIKYDIIEITPMMEAFEGALAKSFKGLAEDTTEENIQARIRGILLMALSNKFGKMVLATGNKSEMSVGYSTLYGDLCGGFAVLKDVYKTKVYELGRWRNQNLPSGGLGPSGQVIPENTFTRAPSAELKPGQTDQDSLPPYDVLDDILHGFIEEDKSIDEVVAQGHDAGTVAKVEKMLYVAEYKRRQAPPGVKITRRLFGRDRRYPIVNAFRDKPGTGKRK
ncbi:MAG: NAD+ synthase [Proteobacteria bacterium]|nr:NAD+ synthase [Pseudomonadota bacterium]